MGEQTQVVPGEVQPGDLEKFLHGKPWNRFLGTVVESPPMEGSKRKKRRADFTIWFRRWCLVIGDLMFLKVFPNLTDAVISRITRNAQLDPECAELPSPAPWALSCANSSCDQRGCPVPPGSTNQHPQGITCFPSASLTVPNGLRAEISPFEKSLPISEALPAHPFVTRCQAELGLAPTGKQRSLESQDRNVTITAWTERINHCLCFKTIKESIFGSVKRQVGPRKILFYFFNIIITWQEGASVGESGSSHREQGTGQEVTA